MEKVAATRAVIDREIDWPCIVHKLYAETNFGCSVGPIRAITWFFENVEEGIILEDDCVPHSDFFGYSRTLLERYRHDERVWCISGNNFQNGKWRGDGSYYFSVYTHTWGWASWRRCWRQYDVDLTLWPSLRNSTLLRTIFEDDLERQYWSEIWDNTYSRAVPVTWWDYQWAFLCQTNGGLTVLPNRNLVSNVGFGTDATHTTMSAEPTKVNGGLGQLTHPRFVLRDTEADSYTFDHHFGGISRRLSRKLTSRIRHRLSRYWQQLQRSLD